METEKDPGIPGEIQETKKENKWGKVETVNVSEIMLHADSGGTRLELGWETIKGESNMMNSSLNEILAQTFELMGIPAEKASEFINKVDGDPDTDKYGLEKIDMSLKDLSELTGKDSVDTRDALGKAVEHFLELKKEQDQQ